MLQKWYLNSACTIGRMHLRSNPPIPCQDSVKILNKNNVSAMVLSDGCGSAPLSEKGSLITVNVLSEYICENFDNLYSMSDKDIKVKIINEIINSINDYIIANSSIIEDFKKENPSHYQSFAQNFRNQENILKIYPCTLFDATVQFVAVKDNRVLIGRLGDGLIGCVKDNSLMILSSEDKVGVEENVTVYPTTVVIAPENSKYSFDCFEIIKDDDIEKYSMFFIVSDGVAEVIVGQDNQEKFLYLDEVNELISKKENLLDVLENTYKPMKGIWDDLSIVLMDNGNVKIDNIIVREYDEDGNTIRNDKVVSLDEKFEENLIEEYSSMQLDEGAINSISDFIEDNERRKFILEATKIIKNVLSEEKTISFIDLKKKISGIWDELDIEQILMYLDKCDILSINTNNEIVFKG